MSEKSVLQGVVRKERAYSALLCNLMQKYPLFRHEMTKLLFPEADGTGLQPSEIQSEPLLLAKIKSEQFPVSFGRPDILIQSRRLNLCLIIEVKVRPECGLTSYQTLDGECDEEDARELQLVEPRNYLEWLSLQGQERKKLVYLVPTDWAYERKLQERITNLSGVEIKYWHDVRDIILADPEANAILQEFGKLLSTQDQRIRFTKKEIAMTLSADFFDAFRKVRKLESIVDGCEKKAKKEGISTYSWNTEVEYGHYFDISSKKNLLWLGITLELNRDYPLCFGIDEKCLHRVPGLREAFSAACRAGGFPEACSDSNDTWIFSSFPHEMLEKALMEKDAAEAIWQKFEPVLKRLREVSSEEVAADAKKGPFTADSTESKPRRQAKG